MASNVHDVTFNVPPGAELSITGDLHSCLQDGKVMCDWSTLERLLIDHIVSDQWWDLTDAERHSIAEMAIRNTLFYALWRVRGGKADCGGGEGGWKESPQCEYNGIVRYLKFASPSPFIDSVSKCYWKRNDADVEHCFATSTPYNLPCYLVGVYGGRFGHVLCAIHIKQGFESLDNFMIFQYTTADVKPGNYQMPTGKHVRIDDPIRINCDNYSHNSPANFMV